MKRGLGLAMIVLGALVLVGLALFFYVALGFRHSFTSSDVPLIDFIQGLAMLSPIVLIAGALVYFGFRWRKA